MKLVKKLSIAGALLLLVSLSVSSQALTVDSGFKTGSWADFGVLTRDPRWVSDRGKSSATVWTDDFSSTLSALKRK